MALQSDPNLRATLAEALAQRKSRNRAYSLRAFARKLGISPSYLSEILAGKKGVAELTASRLRSLIESDSQPGPGIPEQN